MVQLNTEKQVFVVTQFTLNIECNHSGKQFRIDFQIEIQSHYISTRLTAVLQIMSYIVLLFWNTLYNDLKKMQQLGFEY